MTLLSMVEAAADEIGTGNRPTSVIANTAPDVQKYLRLLHKVGNRLRVVFAWQALTEERTFTATSGELQTSALPTDFDRFVKETFWDRTNVNLVSGPVGATEWQGMKATNYGDTANRKVRHRGNALHILPAMSGGESMAFEYVSKNWIDTNQDGVGDTSVFEADDDTTLLDEELLTLGLIFEFLETEGLPANKAAVEYEQRFNQLVRNDQPNAKVLVAGDIFGGGRHFSGAPTVSGTTI